VVFPRALTSEKAVDALASPRRTDEAIELVHTAVASAPILESNRLRRHTYIVHSLGGERKRIVRDG
jgi:hypothetical protein